MPRLTALALLLVLIPSLAFAQAARTPAPAVPKAPPVAAAPPAVAAAQPGANAFTTAGGLATACEQPAAAGRNFCLGVIFGSLSMYNVIADLAYAGENVLTDGGRVICAPADVNFNDVREQFPVWMARHQDAKDLSAPRALFFMLGELYPCESRPLLPKP